jgi:5'-nucleotidase
MRPLRKTILVLLWLAAAPLRAQTVTLLHFSDYHSHALPFYTDEGERGGIARAIGYLRQEKRRGALVFSGGDTINIGAPAWSDKFGCAEWPWLDGLVDAMAFGNHDADYGFADFERCRRAVRYPILSANTNGFRPYAVFTVNGRRIGVFAVAGNDFKQLVKVPELTFRDPLAAAREAVKALREREHVDAVVMIGHQESEDDYAMAKAVPGIDVIFGSHSHLKRDLTQIPGTSTWFISPSQYLTYISRVQLTFAQDQLTVRGALMPVDRAMREDRPTARRVQAMQQELERDPKYSELFTPIGHLGAPMSVDALMQRTLDVMRKAGDAEVALSTISSVRGSLPSGTLSMELLRAALPYDNEIVVCTLTGAQLQRLRTEPDVVSGGTGAGNKIRVATTDYLAHVAYRELFACEPRHTGLRVRDEVRKSLTTKSLTASPSRAQSALPPPDSPPPAY